MGRELGRISGPLLADNLRRNGSNLAFDTQVLYLDVVNGRVGFNSNTPVATVYTPNAIDTVNLIVDTSANIANFTIGTNNIQNAVSTITISPNQASNPTIVVPSISATNLNFFNNTLQNTVSNDNINITASGTGTIKLNNNTTVTGNLHATGAITWDGNITLGDAYTDSITLNAEVNSNVVPNVTNTYNLGSTGSTPALITTGLQINLATAPSTATVGTTWTDTSGNNNNGTLAGSNSHLSYTSNDGGGISISGSETGTYISTGYNIASNTFTISMVASLNPTTFWSSLWGDESYSAGKGYFAYFISATSLNVGSPSGTANFTVSNITNINVWDFVISGTSVTVYQNGSSLGTKTFSAPSGGYASTGLYFASRHANGGSGPTDNCVGTYYAMRVYNVALNSTQILNNYNAVGATYGLGVSGANLSWATTYANTISASTIGTTNLTTTTFTGSGTNSLNGNVTIGTTSANTLTITAHISSKLAPATTNTYDLGSSSYYWNNVYAVTFNDGNITASTNVIQTNTTNSNLRLIANGTGQVVFSKLNASGNATVGGTLGVTGTTTFSNNVTSGAITQTGSYNITGNATLGAITSVGDITAANPLTLPTFTINGSVITGTANSNLKLTANTGQSVEVTGATKFDNNVSIAGTLGVTGTSSLKNTVSGAITQTGDYNLTGNYLTSGTISSGSITAADPLTLPSVTINGSVISGTASNTNLQFVANGTGIVRVQNNNVQINNNLTVGNGISVTGLSTITNLTVGDITQTGDFNQTGTPNITGQVSVGSFSILGSYFNIGNFDIANQTITGTVSNGDVTYLANGTGSVWLGNDIKINGNNIINNWINVSVPLQDELGNQLLSEDGQNFYSEFGLATSLQDSLVLTPTGTGNVRITGTNSLILPIGDDSTRVLPANGEVRFNDLNLNIEAFQSSGYVNFINLFSQDHNTYITGELTPGAADNTMRFATNGSVKATITPSALTSDSTIFGNININANTINNVNSSSNITFSTSGTGLAKFNGQLIASGNNFLLPTSGGLTFNNTGNGYNKFTGNSGVVFPVGTNSNYPVAPVTGATRYNSDLNYGEVFNGTTWQPVGGSSAVLSQSQVDDAMYAWDLILG